MVVMMAFNFAARVAAELTRFRLLRVHWFLFQGGEVNPCSEEACGNLCEEPYLICRCVQSNVGMICQRDIGKRI